jgi:hypothetical protein
VFPNKSTTGVSSVTSSVFPNKLTTGISSSLVS